MSYKKDDKNQEQQNIKKNPELWIFKTRVPETTLPDYFGQTLDLDHGSFQQKNLKHGKAIYKYIRYDI